MSDYVTDTHSLFWYLTANPRLGTEAQVVFQRAEQGQDLLYIPSIVIAELYYLNAKFGCPLNFASEFQSLRRAAQFHFVDFRAEDVLDFDVLATIPEMHDRIIAGVAYALGAPLLTRDPTITGSHLVQTVW